MIRRARVEMDEKSRNELYGKFQERLYALQPITFLYTRPSMFVVSKRFDNVKLHKLGLDVLEWEGGGTKKSKFKIQNSK
jgi:ABC-type transport system substrate-binding protein